MSFLKNLRKKLGLPPITLKTFIGGSAKPAGTFVEGTLTRVGAGVPIATAIGAQATVQGAAAADQAQAAATALKQGMQAKAAVDSLLKGPVPWIILGLTIAVMASGKGKGK